jgi:ribosomal subunit interface protein
MPPRAYNPQRLLTAGISTHYRRGLRRRGIHPRVTLTGRSGSRRAHLNHVLQVGPQPQEVRELENILKLSEDEMDAQVEIVVTSRNVDVSEHFRSHITERLVRLERYDSNMIRYDVELDHENNPRQSKASQRVAIVGHGKGGTVNAEARGSNFHSALDAAVAKLEAQLRRTHDRVREHHAGHQQAAVAPTQA